MAVPVSSLQAIAPSAIIELFVLELNIKQHGANETYRFYSGVNTKDSGNIIWAGNTYISLPVEADGFEYSGNGQLPRPKVRVSNIFGTITALLLGLPNGLDGAKFTRIRTLAMYLDAVNFTGNVNPYGTPDPTASFPDEIYYIDRKSSETKDIVEFELAAAFDLVGVRAPKRQCIANICQWKYRGPECGYTGIYYFDANGNTVASQSLDVCGKKLSDCKLRFEPIRLLGTVTTGSSIITLDSAFNVLPGEPVSGFGVPDGTTVLSVSGTSVTLSANSTKTTSVVKTGTLQQNRLEIILTNATGVFKGMVVSGPKIPTGAIVESISGNTITLGQPVNLIDVLSLVATRSGQLVVDDSFSSYSSSYLYLNNYTGITVDMYVSGPTILISDSAQVTRYTNSAYAGNVLDLSYKAKLQNSEGSYSFYSPQAQTAQTYTFSAESRYYSFGANNGIPFGSFPGIGTYFA